MSDPVGTYVAPVKTGVSLQEAVAGFRVVARAQWGTDKPETVALLTAQSALESGRWAAMWNYNPSNIKNENSRAGQYTCIELNEVLDGKVVWFHPTLGELVRKGGPARYPEKPWALPPGHFQCRMRAFAHFADGIADKLEFLERPRYRHAKSAALVGDPIAYTERCRAAGYFTAPLAPYQRAVASLFREFLPIAKDNSPPAIAPEQYDQLCNDMAECMRVEIPEWLTRRLDALQKITLQYDADEQARLRRKAVAEDT